MPCHRAWAPAPLGAHLSTKWECTAPQIDTPICTCHNNSSVHLTTTSKLWGFRRITDGMQSGWKTLQDSILSSSRCATTLLDGPCQEQLGSGLSASALVLDIPAAAYANGGGLFLRLECGAEELTADNVVFYCPIPPPVHGLHRPTVLDDKTVDWLLNTCPET